MKDCPVCRVNGTPCANPVLGWSATVGLVLSVVWFLCELAVVTGLWQ